MDSLLTQFQIQLARILQALTPTTHAPGKRKPQADTIGERSS